MKKLVLTALSASLILSGIATATAENSTYTAKETTAKQYDSTTMRMEYYNKYLGKGYDVSSLKSYLDGSTTTESQFWEALKQVQNNHEVPDRRGYVEKLKNKGYNVSGFSETVIWDSGKFWDMVRIVESGKKYVPETKKEEYKIVETKKDEWKKEDAKKIDEKKVEAMKKVEEKKPQTSIKISSVQSDRLKSMMKIRIDKIPMATRDATLARLETTLVKNIASAQQKNARLLKVRYEILLSVVQEEMDNVDDDTLINSLF